MLVKIKRNIGAAIVNEIEVLLSWFTIYYSNNKLKSIYIFILVYGKIIIVRK